MNHAPDDGASEPLLKGVSDSTSAYTTEHYDPSSGLPVDPCDMLVRKKPNLRDSYLKQLEYTPLIFKVKRPIQTCTGKLS